MKIWVVGVSDCEANSVVCLCTTKEIAERELFKERDRLVAEWNSRCEAFKGEPLESHTHEMYGDMIKALAGNDYEEWDNYPHDRPYLYETEVITQ